MPQYNRLRGTKDVIPAQTQLWEQIIMKAARTLKLYDYSLIVTPVIEETALFIRGVGEGSDIVMKEMYNFQDKKGREIVLRPEGTASVVRAYIENSLPVKSNLYYIGPMFRYEKPQKGRDREFYQIGVESFGDPTPYKDAETVKLAKTFLKELGINAFEIQVNSTGCKECKPKYIEVLLNFLEPRKAMLCEDCLKKIERGAAIRVLDCKNEKCRETVMSAPLVTAHLCEPCDTHHKLFLEALKINGVKFIENPRIVRGLDYYTKTVFEFITDKIGAQQNTILAGGRYDNLVWELGGKKTPAVGFAAGVERIAEVINAGGGFTTEDKVDIFVITDKQYIKNAYALVNTLRESGIKAVMSYEEKSFKSQFREADARKAKYAAIIGETEIQNKTVMLKNMETGEQKETNEQGIINLFK